MKIHELLTANPKVWCQNTFAVGPDGKPCPAEDPTAVQWSLPSLLKKFYPIFEERQVAYKALLDHFETKSLAQYNDRKETTIDTIIVATKKLDI